MSELIHKNDNRATIRWKLLTGASALALTAYVASASAAMADDADRPLVWLELDGQLSRLQDSQEIYAPPFVSLTPSPFTQPQSAERPPLYGLDEGASISFQPEDSSWVFSASIRYGRTGSSKHVRHQTYPMGNYQLYATICYFGYCSTGTFGLPRHPYAARFTDARTRESESHTILDFQAGKDLGLGLFGQNASSTLSAGIRVAQFRSQSRVVLGEDPDWSMQIQNYHISLYSGLIVFDHQVTYQPYHSFAGTFRADRSFHGIGPSLSWKSSVPFAGNSKDGELAIDWGVNAALLFGRQKTATRHQTTDSYHSRKAVAGDRVTVYHHPASAPSYRSTRSRNVTVPNVGGSVGLSWRLQNFKMSFGYKADFFFNAIDGGIDARKSEDRGFYGPYASISIGLGD